MYSLQTTTEKLNTALRSRNADFFKMDVSRRLGSLPAQDHKPLRRVLGGVQDVFAMETNENMCFALWQLMAQS